ncbi:hypothetical protein [Alkalihalobacterium sp. APHAB7]|uniref:hypothetical protein n=1 Tax=Alkalihalobacterium sp. APHAB7 TaxID=3402081 RepID=UPI003AADDA5A
MEIKVIKKREIILHVGLHKTGTTSIQRTLFNEENNQILEKKGYIYPRSWPSNHSIPIYSVFSEHPERYHINIRNGYTTANIIAKNQEYLRNFEKEIVNRGKSKIIISGEDISVLPHENLQAFKKYIMSLFQEETKVTVMMYLRNPVSWSISNIQEIIKSGGFYETALTHMNTTYKNNFKNKIEKFIQVFGKQNIKLYSFEETLPHQYGVIGHFLSSLNFKESEINQFHIQKANESISLIAGNILSYINVRIPMIYNGKINENRAQRDYVPLLNIKGSKFDIPISDKIKIFESRKEDTIWLRDNYGIDYSNLSGVQDSNLKYEFTEEIILSIKKAYYQLSPPLKKLVEEYLKIQLEKNSNARSKKLILKLLGEIS